MCCITSQSRACMLYLSKEDDRTIVFRLLHFTIALIGVKYGRITQTCFTTLFVRIINDLEEEAGAAAKGKGKTLARDFESLLPT